MHSQHRPKYQNRILPQGFSLIQFNMQIENYGQWGQACNTMAESSQIQP